MKFRDYYDVMGVSRDATQEQIKRAYRKLARKYHPDVSDDPDAEARFKEVGEAYEVLKDPEKRAAYDQLGENWKAGQEFRPPPGWEPGFEFDGDIGGERFSDFFETLFRRGGPGRGFRTRRDFQMHGEDRHARVVIDLRDTYSGATRAITLRVPELTEDGRVATKSRTLNVRIPKGVRDGQKIRLGGQGGPGFGDGRPGDLFLEVEIRPPRRFRVDGGDVYLELPVAPWEAALGATVKVPIPSGDVDLKIPPGSNQGSRLRLRGKGIPGDPPGDLYVVLDVRLPPASTESAKALYERMAKEMAFDPRVGL